MGRNFLHSLDEQTLKPWLIENGEAPFRAKQIFNWLWNLCARNLDEMTNIGKSVREKRSSSFVCSPLSLVRKEESEETIKFLWKLHDGALVESVLICALYCAARALPIRIAIQRAKKLMLLAGS